jgi:Na+/proline symporter
LNAKASTTVNDFYLKYMRPDADDRSLLRVSRLATVGWGLVQLAVALAMQWVDRSVLDAGLSVLSVPAGPVLGAFLLGVLTRRVRAVPMVIGMAVGTVVLLVVYRTGGVAFTWFPFMGASVTMLTALVVNTLGRSDEERGIGRHRPPSE